MANSFIEYKGKGFWINDGMLSLAASYIFHDVAELDINDERRWIEDLMSDIQSCGEGYSSGFLSMNLDEHLKIKGRSYIFSDILNNLILKFSEGKEIIEPEELNLVQLDIEYNGEWDVGMERVRVLKILKFLKRLVDQELEIILEDPVNYEF